MALSEIDHVQMSLCSALPEGLTEVVVAIIVEHIDEVSLVPFNPTLSAAGNRLAENQRSVRCRG
jgi:hypothetical protein